jgi:hypothetical protein
MGKRARGGTRTAFQPLPTLGSPENIPNPSQSGIGTAGFEGKCVHNVHTPFCPLRCPMQPTSPLIQNCSRPFSRLALQRGAGSLRTGIPEWRLH